MGQWVIELFCGERQVMTATLPCRVAQCMCLDSRHAGARHRSLPFMHAETWKSGDTDWWARDRSRNLQTPELISPCQGLPITPIQTQSFLPARQGLTFQQVLVWDTYMCIKRKHSGQEVEVWRCPARLIHLFLAMPMIIKALNILYLSSDMKRRICILPCW